MEWIEANLTWYVNYEAVDAAYKPFPPLDERAREVFGKSFDEVSKEYFGDSSKWDAPLTESYEAHRAALAKSMGLFDYDRAVTEELRKSEISDVKRYLEFEDFADKYNDWYSEQPEVKEIEIFNERIREEGYINNFCGQKLNKPGTLVEIKDKQGKIKQYLIGDINKSGEVCNDCMPFEDDDIVVRYKVVYHHEQEGSTGNTE